MANSLLSWAQVLTAEAREPIMIKTLPAEKSERQVLAYSVAEVNSPSRNLDKDECSRGRSLSCPWPKLKPVIPLRSTCLPELQY